MDPILKIEGDLIVKGRSMFPRPGQVQFEIKGADELVAHLIDIKADILPEVATNDHIYGKLTVEIFAKVVDNSAYAATLPQGKRIPNIVEIVRVEDGPPYLGVKKIILNSTDTAVVTVKKTRKPRTEKVKDGTKPIQAA